MNRRPPLEHPAFQCPMITDYLATAGLLALAAWSFWWWIS